MSVVQIINRGTRKESSTSDEILNLKRILQHVTWYTYYSAKTISRNKIVQINTCPYIVLISFWENWTCTAFHRRVAEPSIILMYNIYLRALSEVEYTLFSPSLLLYFELLSNIHFLRKIDEQLVVDRNCDSYISNNWRVSRLVVVWCCNQ